MSRSRPWGELLLRGGRPKARGAHGGFLGGLWGLWESSWGNVQQLAARSTWAAMGEGSCVLAERRMSAAASAEGLQERAGYRDSRAREWCQ